MHQQHQQPQHTSTQLAGAVRYTDNLSRRSDTPPNEYLRYDIKPPDGEAPALEIWGIFAIVPWLSLLRNLLGHTWKGFNQYLAMVNLYFPLA